MIKISAVSYLNTYPFLYGILNNEYLQKNVEITTDYPSVCAQKLKHNEVDIGLVPIAILPELSGYQIISDYCIAANGAVKSVLLVSDVPLNKIETILLDYQSRTSIMLSKILAKNYWKINPKWQNAKTDYEKEISKHTAGVVIGDRALNILDKYKFVYDLSEEWQKFTNLPFVFATWTANKQLPEKIIMELNSALNFGVNNVEKTLLNFSDKIQNINFDANEYLTQFIDYELDENKREAIDKYLKCLSKLTNSTSIKTR